MKSIWWSVSWVAIKSLAIRSNFWWFHWKFSIYSSFRNCSNSRLEISAEFRNWNCDLWNWWNSLLVKWVVCSKKKSTLSHLCMFLLKLFAWTPIQKLMANASVLISWQINGNIVLIWWRKPKKEKQMKMHKHTIQAYFEVKSRLNWRGKINCWDYLI